MTSLYPVPISFFVGAKVQKKFGGKWCTDTVDWVDTDEGETLWHVTYDDFDEEQMTRTERSQAIVYHPLLDIASDLKVAEPRDVRVVCGQPTTAPGEGVVGGPYRTQTSDS